MTALCVVGLVGASVVATALAGPPRGGQRYSGTGADRWFQGGTWVRHGTGSFHFGTTKRYLCRLHGKTTTCQYITHFHGTYSSSCNGGSLFVKANNIWISKNGTFSRTFRKPNATFTLWGAFQGPHGTTAKVNYRVKFSNSCQSWVRGTAFPG